MTTHAPSQGEVRHSIQQIENGFVFNFDTPARVVSRMMFYLSQGLEVDWLERYLEGIQGVTPATVRRVFRHHVRPEDMTVLIVGDPDRIGEELAGLGTVTVWEVEGGRSPLTPSRPSGWRRSRR